MIDTKQLKDEELGNDSNGGNTNITTVQSLIEEFNSHVNQRSERNISIRKTENVSIKFVVPTGKEI